MILTTQDGLVVWPRMTSVGSVELEKIKKYDVGRRHRRHRVQKQVRNVTSDVPVAFCSDWRHLNQISRKYVI